MDGEESRNRISRLLCIREKIIKYCSSRRKPEEVPEYVGCLCGLRKDELEALSLMLQYEHEELINENSTNLQWLSIVIVVLGMLVENPAHTEAGLVNFILFGVLIICVLLFFSSFNYYHKINPKKAAKIRIALGIIEQIKG